MQHSPVDPMCVQSSIPRRVAFISPRFDEARTKFSPVFSDQQREKIDRFLSLIQTSEMKMVRTECPCGGGSESIVVASIDRYGLPLQTVVCETCGTLRFDPYFDAHSVERFYTEIYQGLYSRSTDLDTYFTRQMLYGKKVLRYLNEAPGSGRRVLEIGCGAGGSLSVFQSAGWDCFGCEYDSRLIAYAQAHGLSGVKQENLLATLDRLGESSCDFIFSHHVFEHVWNPVEMLRTAATMLKPGGVMLHIVPDILSIDVSEFPAGDAIQYLHAAHIYNYTQTGLELLARRVGRHALRVSPPSMSTPWSHAAEMWIEFPVTDANSTPLLETQSGAIVRNYLQRTELKHRYGLCRSQWRLRLAALQRALLYVPKVLKRCYSSSSR